MGVAKAKGVRVGSGLRRVSWPRAFVQRGYRRRFGNGERAAFRARARGEGPTEKAMAGANGEKELSSLQKKIKNNIIYLKKKREWVHVGYDVVPN